MIDIFHNIDHKRYKWYGVSTDSWGTPTCGRHRMTYAISAYYH